MQVVEEAGETAAIHPDGVVDFVPERPVEMAGRNAEIAADIDDDGADGAAAHFGGDLLLGGQAGETRAVGGIGWLGLGLGVGWRDRPRGAWRACGGQADGRRLEVLAASGMPAQPGLQRRGATQATGDAGENNAEIGGAEGTGELNEAWDGGVLLNRFSDLPAVVDQSADEAEDAADRTGDVTAGPVSIGSCGRGGGLGRGRHERNKNTNEGLLSRKENLGTQF